MHGAGSSGNLGGQNVTRNAATTHESGDGETQRNLRQEGKGEWYCPEARKSQDHEMNQANLRTK